jgi:thymidylate synthase ThyX
MYERMTVHLLATSAFKTEGMARRRATEDARYVLPLAQTTQIGMMANARTWGHVISRLLSHSHSEGRALGTRLKAVLEPIAPSLFPDKHIHALPFPASALDELARRASSLSVPPERPSCPTDDGVTLIHYDPAADERLVAALLFRVTALDGPSRTAIAAAMSPLERSGLLRTAFRSIAAHDAALREFETVCYTMELVHSESCYHQFVRHRMATQLAQPRTPALGYTVPPLVEDAGCLALYREGMDVLADAFHRLGGDERASIILGNGHNRRTLLHLNARELIELSRLRADRHAQWDVRARTNAIVRLVGAVHPDIAWACGGRDEFKAGTLPIAPDPL